MNRQTTILLCSVVVIFFFVVPFFWQDPISFFEQYLEKNPVTSGGIFVLLLAVATVAAPITTLPLVPIAATVFGPMATACLAVVGWGIGAAGAFLIARHLGKPTLERLVSFQTIQRYEQAIPVRAEFLGIVFLRMVTPVDIASYAIGLFSRISFWRYMAATLIGIIPFSFVFAYLGDAYANGEYAIVSVLAVFVALAVLVGYFVFARKKDK
jgi:uncharacterized membrane protein YdjX (TVP38/TMEM64 family)